MLSAMPAAEGHETYQRRQQAVGKITDSETRPRFKSRSYGRMSGSDYGPPTSNKRDTPYLGRGVWWCECKCAAVIVHRSCLCLWECQCSHDRGPRGRQRCPIFPDRNVCGLFGHCLAPNPLTLEAQRMQRVYHSLDGMMSSIYSPTISLDTIICRPSP